MDDDALDSLVSISCGESYFVEFTGGPLRVILAILGEKLKHLKSILKSFKES